MFVRHLAAKCKTRVSEFLGRASSSLGLQNLVGDWIALASEAYREYSAT